MVLWLFGTFAVLLLIGTPIAASLGLAAVVTIIMGGIRMNMVVVAQTLFAGMTSYQLMAIPLFILCGNLMGDGGLSKRLVDFINLFFRRFKGGMAYVTIAASAFFAAISGSSPATTAAIGGIMAPEMQKNGYDEDFSLATAAAAGTLGQIIPKRRYGILCRSGRGFCGNSVFDRLRTGPFDDGFDDGLCPYVCEKA